MTTVTDTQRARLERAFETLKNQNITPILILTGSPGVFDWGLSDYKRAATAAHTADSWVGAHAGAQESGGANWVDGRLLHASGEPVQELWFSFPMGREDIARALQDAAEDQAFYASWFLYDNDGDVVGPGTDAACVRLVLKEDDDD